jgi:hypothetical protein
LKALSKNAAETIRKTRKVKSISGESEYQARCLIGELLGSLTALLVDTGVTVVGCVRSVDGSVVLLGPLLHSLDGLPEVGWGGLVADGLLRGGRVVASGSWLGGSELAHAVVGFPGSLDLTVVLLVFLSEVLEAVLHALGGDDGAAVGVFGLDVAWDVGGRHCG